MKVKVMEMEVKELEKSGVELSSNCHVIGILEDGKAYYYPPENRKQFYKVLVEIR
jgi:hypothetical protein